MSGQALEDVKAGDTDTCALKLLNIDVRIASWL